MKLEPATVAWAGFALAVTFLTFATCLVAEAPRIPAAGRDAGRVVVAVVVVVASGAVAVAAGGGVGVVVVVAVVVAGGVAAGGVVVDGVVVVVDVLVVDVVVVDVVVVGEQLEGAVALAEPGGPGFTPSPQFANSWTLTWTLLLEPMEKVPENAK